MVTSSELAVQQVVDSDVSLALSVTAAVVALLIGVLFVATTMVLELTADRRQLWTLHAIGIGQGARLVMIGIETGLIALIGGLLGSAMGYGGIVALNAGVGSVLEGSVMAVWRPAFIGYGVAMALAVAVVTIPILGLVTVVIDRGVNESRG
ncbi:MAG: FtsX-like permease family protein [Natrialbaceae archaeon]|nr:FtsX-like permease family protein [Natrialbaceae archaeon]